MKKIMIALPVLCILFIHSYISCGKNGDTLPYVNAGTTLQKKQSPLQKYTKKLEELDNLQMTKKDKVVKKQKAIQLYREAIKELNKFETDTKDQTAKKYEAELVLYHKIQQFPKEMGASITKSYKYFKELEKEVGYKNTLQILHDIQNNSTK